MATGGQAIVDGLTQYTKSMNLRKIAVVFGCLGCMMILLMISTREGVVTVSKRRIIGTALVAGAAISAVLTTANPAHAHFVSIYHGSDNAWISNNDHTVTVADLEDDSRPVYAELRLTRSPYSDTVTDYYGGNFATRTYAGYIDSFRLCESGLGCTGWVKA